MRASRVELGGGQKAPARWPRLWPGFGALLLCSELAAGVEKLFFFWAVLFPRCVNLKCFRNITKQSSLASSSLGLP